MAKTDYENKLQKAIRHARRTPEVKVARIAALYDVNVTTLRRRVAGKSHDYATAFRDRQLFTVGEEKAIAAHVGEMADCGFPLNDMLLRHFAQDMLNERNVKQTGKSKDPIDLETTPHKVGKNWVDRFLARNPGLKKTYIRYQERARAAASNDIELQADFLRKLSNLMRRKGIEPQDLWNCDEKGKTHQF